MTHRGQHAERYADQAGERERGQGQLQRYRERHDDVVECGMIGRQRGAEITAQRISQEAQVLHPYRLIDPELLTQSRQRLCGGMIAQHKLGDVAGQQVHGDEHHDADAEQHEHKLQQSLHQILCHGLAPQPAA